MPTLNDLGRSCSPNAASITSTVRYVPSEAFFSSPCSDFLFVSRAATTSVDQGHFFVAQSIVAAFPLVMLAMRGNFEVNRWKNSDYSPYAQSE